MTKHLEAYSRGYLGTSERNPYLWSSDSWAAFQIGQHDRTAGIPSRGKTLRAGRGSFRYHFGNPRDALQLDNLGRVITQGNLLAAVERPATEHACRGTLL